MSDLAPTSERNLVSRIINGDEQAFAELARREYQALVRVAYHVLHSQAQAQEIVQDGLLELWRSRKTLNPQQSTAGLLTTIVRRKAINEWQRTVAETRREIKISEQVEYHMGEIITPSAEDETLERVAFEKMMDELPARTALALRLRFLSQLTFPEIGQALGISDKAAQQVVNRGVEQLRERLGGGGRPGTGANV